ncbi:Uncharacterized protein APZ42_006426, partial [Daphnia magna]
YIFVVTISHPFQWPWNDTFSGLP